jgi:hypothetical protein
MYSVPRRFANGYSPVAEGERGNSQLRRASFGSLSGNFNFFVANMNTLFTVTSSLALSALLLTAQAQTPVTPPAKPTTADRRAATYQGPKVVKNSKALGQKMVQKSKPTDMRVPVPVKKL